MAYPASRQDKTYATPGQDELVVAMYEAGIPDSVIAETLGMRRTLAYARRRFLCGDSIVPRGRPLRGARARWLEQADAIVQAAS